jgi:L-alanine-DL-glutamate epimerase-like enolase superfamily enzyme
MVLHLPRFPEAWALNTDIRVKEVDVFFDPQQARVPLKFGAVVMDRVTLCKARVLVETADGKRGEGWGAMFLADFWSWPTPSIEHDLKENVMKRVAEAYARLITSHTIHAHPVDIFYDLEPELRAMNDRLSHDYTAQYQPFLGALVCASPLDAALHDAFGVANGIDSYSGYGRDFMGDLSRYLGPDFEGRYISDFLNPAFKPEIEVFHLVGGLDKLTPAEVDDSDPDDGLPNCLEEWILRDGVFCLKVKLRGTDLDWDVDRMLAVHDIAEPLLAHLNLPAPVLTADTNEQCDSPDYIIEMLNRVKAKNPACFDRLLYVEQPTGRDLAALAHDMRPLAAIKPVLVDESLTDLESFDLAMEQGWSGVAIKACKCQSAALVLAARAHALGIPYSVQDLTNPSLALFQSVGLAARLSTIRGVEANSRQFFPAATTESERWVHNGMFSVRRGYANTWSLRGPGLGFQTHLLPDMMEGGLWRRRTRKVPGRA